MSGVKGIRSGGELSDYGFRRLVEHVVRSGSPERILTIAGRRWLASKARHHGYGSVVLSDLYVIAQEIAKKGSGAELLVDLVDITLWKMSLTPERTAPLFSVEQVMRARSGDWQRAIHEVDGLGNADDQMLVHTEVALLKKKTNGEPGTHLGVITQATENACPETVEFVAERLAGEFPDVSVRLARSIPMPQQRFDLDFREVPNPGRSFYRVFEAIAERNMDQARQLRPDCSAFLERLHANIGILRAIMIRSPVDFKNHVRELLDDVENSVTGSSVKTFIAAFVIRDGASVPISQHLGILDDLCEVVGIATMFPWLIPVIDSYLRRDPNATRAAVSCMHQRDLSDLFYWRMKIMRVRTDGVHLAESTALGCDLIKADLVASMARSRFDETEPIMTSIKTAIGAVHAFARMAEQVVEQDWGLGQALLKTGFDLLGDDSEVAAFHSRCEILQLLIRGDGPFRNDAVAMAISQTEEISPLVLRHEMSVELGRCIAAAFQNWTDEELLFLRHVNDCCKKSKQRSAIQEGIVAGLCQVAMVGLGKVLLGEDQDVMRDDQDSQSCITESLGCDTEFVASLGAQVVRIDRQLGTLLFRKAAEAVALVDDDERERAARDVTIYVFDSVPELAWDVYRRCGCDAWMFAEAAKRSLRQYVHRKLGRRDCWLRCCIEHSMYQGQLDEEELPDRTTIHAAFEATKISKDPLAVEMNRDHSCSKTWCEGVTRAIKEYIGGVVGDDQWKQYQRYKLIGAIEYLMSLDWSSFVTVCCDSEPNRYAEDISQRGRLVGSLFAQHVSPEDIIKDIDCIRAASVRWAMADDNPVAEVRDSILAWSAANMPEFTVQAIASLSAGDRARFMGDLEHWPVREPWNREHIQSIIQSLSEHDDEVGVLDAYVRLLKWLLTKSCLVEEFYEDLYIRSRCCGDSHLLFSVAEFLQFVHPAEAAKLMIESLGRAKVQGDGQTIFRVLANVQNALECNVKDENVDVASFAKHLKQEWFRREGSDGAVTLDVDYAMGLLAKISIDDKQGLSDAMGSAAQVVDFQCAADVGLLVEKINQSESIETDTRKAFIRHVAGRALRRGICQWPEIAGMITGRDTKMEVLIELISEGGFGRGSVWIDRATREIRSLTVSDQSYAFRRIAESSLAGDSSVSTSFYVLSLESASLETNASSLLFALGSLVYACMRHRKLDADRLCDKIREIASRDLFDSERNILFNDWKAVCSLSAALIMWPCDHCRFEEYSKEAFQEPISARDSMWDHVLERAYAGAYDAHGSTFARNMFTESFILFPEESRAELADRVLSLCLAYRSAGRPLACYQVWRYAPEPRYVPLIRELLPRCSKSVTAVAHLSLAMCGGKDDSLVDTQEFDKAWKLSQLDIPISDPRFKKDLLTMYAIVHGVRGAAESLLQLLPDTNKPNTNLNGIVSAALGSARSQDRLVQELWSRTGGLYGV